MLEQIRRYLSRQPFQEFVLNLADGRSLVVKSPDWMWFPPKGSPFYWHQEDNTAERLNAFLLVSVRGAGEAMD